MTEELNFEEIVAEVAAKLEGSTTPSRGPSACGTVGVEVGLYTGTKHSRDALAQELASGPCATW